MSVFPCCGFKLSTCESLLKKIVVDAEKLIEKKNNEIKDIRDKISKLLCTHRELETHDMIPRYIERKNLISVLQYVIYFAGQIDPHLLLIKSQRELHPELKEAVANLCYVRTRYNEIPALENLASQFSKKYGKKYGTKFMVNATMSEKADLGVKEQIQELLLVQNPPTVEERNKFLQEVANEFRINWDPVASELYFSKLYR